MPRIPFDNLVPPEGIICECGIENAPNSEYCECGNCLIYEPDDYEE
jgi:hypothetical protein